ncbi:MAG: type II secretion system F family protein [Acidobacteria bacterium]|nr:type II secretion system F family protein [Acidobacteriota bacterium]
MIFLAIFGGVWAVSIVAWLIFSRASRNADLGKIKSRILDGPKELVDKVKEEAAPKLLQTDDASGGNVARQVLKMLDLQDKLQVLLEQAGLRWKPATILQASFVLFLALFLVARGAGAPGLPLQLGIGLIGGVSPVLYVLRTKAKRLHKFEEQFPESLEFVSRSMRAGHAFSVALEMIHREFGEPLGGEFRRCFDEHNLGMPLEAALLKLAKRVPSLDVHFFVSAVLLQKRTGGNLAEILDKLATLMRERFKLRGKIKAISAHGRMTGTALTCIPIGVALMMFYVNPSYVSFFIEDAIGNAMLGGAITLQLIGYLVIQKIVSIEV